MLMQTHPATHAVRAHSLSLVKTSSAPLPLSTVNEIKHERLNADPSSDTASAQSPQARGSPVPVPNGKPASPYIKESTPMSTGAGQTISSKDPKAAAAAANEMRNVVRRKLTGYVGFANLPNQWHRKSVRKGFSFNVMVVGK